MIVKVGIFTEKSVRRDAVSDYARAWATPGPDSPGGQMFVLADGVGRGNLSELASQYVSLQIKKLYYQLLEKQPTTSPAEALEQVIKWTNKRLRQHADDQMALDDMGAAVVVAVMIRDRMLVAWTGNCRAYYMRGDDGYARIVTEDHLQVDRATGVNLPVYMGLRKRIPVEINGIDLHPGDVLVLCTDGIYRQLSPDDIVEIVEGRMSPQMAASDLVMAAVGRDNEDDATAMVIQFHAEDTKPTQNSDEDLYASYDEISKLLADTGVLLDTVETMQVAVEERPAPIPPFLSADFDWSSIDDDDENDDYLLEDTDSTERLELAGQDTAPLPDDDPDDDESAPSPIPEEESATAPESPPPQASKIVIVNQSVPTADLIAEEPEEDTAGADPLAFIDAYDDYEPAAFDDFKAVINPLRAVTSDDIAEADSTGTNIDEPDFLAGDLAQDDDADPVKADLSFLDMVDIDGMVFDDEQAASNTDPDFDFPDDDNDDDFTDAAGDEHDLLLEPSVGSQRRRLLLIGTLLFVGLVAGAVLGLGGVFGGRSGPSVANNPNSPAANLPKDDTSIPFTVTDEPATAVLADASSDTPTDAPTDPPTGAPTAANPPTRPYDVPNGWSEGTVLYVTTQTGVRANVFSPPANPTQYTVGDTVTVALARQAVGYREWYELDGERWWFVDRIGWLAEAELSATPPLRGQTRGD